MTTKLISKRAVAEIIGVHEQTIMRHVRDGTFPPPLRTGGRGSAVRWRVADVEGWIAARVAARQINAEGLS